MKTRLDYLVMCVVSVFTIGAISGVGAMEDKNSLVEGNNSFAFELYSEINTGEGNLFFSPFSISSALAMTYAGARAETERQMLRVLHFGTDQEDFHRRFRELIGDLDRSLSDGIQLSTANALWIQEGYELLEAFLDLVREHYGAGLNSVDFVKETEEARVEINDWVEEETQGKIKDLIKPGVLTYMTRLVLTNAIYFKGEWASKFDEELTREGPFHSGDSSGVEALFMKQDGDFGYFENDAVQVLEVPYAGDSISMIIILPKPGVGLRGLEKSLSYSDYQNWASSLKQQEVDVFIPKFRNTSEFSLGEALSGMGMSAAFSDSADFSGMTGNRELKISKVVHKAFVEVNEEGTEAAAATGVVMVLKSAPIQARKIFRADRPFMFVIRDRNTQSILFMGRVQKPGYHNDR